MKPRAITIAEAIGARQKICRDAVNYFTRGERLSRST
jgi:hypothetical protein